MVKYSIKRLLQSLVTVFIIITVVFLLLRLMPPTGYFADDELLKMTPEQINTQLKMMGLLDNPFVQLFRFYGQILTFNFGLSMKLAKNKPVTSIIGSKFPVSLAFGVVSLIISIILGVLLGVQQARKKGKFSDAAGTVYTIFVNSVPPLVTYALILAFGTRVLGLPSLYKKGNLISAILPVISMSLGSIAGYALWTRRYMVDELNKDYIKLARAKGLPYSTIMTKHVLRNAFVPLAQYLPASFLLTIGGSLLVERYYSIPGMGSLLVDAIQKQDNTVVQTCVLLYSILGIVGVFLGDILMMIIDPRISLDSKGGTR